MMVTGRWKWRGVLVCLMLLAMAAVPTFAQENPQPERPQTVGEYISQSLAPKEPAAPKRKQPNNYVAAPTGVQDQLVAPAYTRPWQPTTEELTEPSRAFFQKLQEICFVLAFICFLIWVVLRGLGKVAPGVFQQKKKLLNVLERQAVAPGKSICAVEVAGKILIVGMTETGMNTLCELQPEEYEKAVEDLKPVELQAVVGGTPESVGNDPKEAYGSILKHYLTIIPGVGGKDEK